MPDSTNERPQPDEVDEAVHVRLRQLADHAVLRGHPSGDERCKSCVFYLEPDKDLSYCFHMNLRILVGEAWWCQWWQPSED